MASEVSIVIGPDDNLPTIAGVCSIGFEFGVFIDGSCFSSASIPFALEVSADADDTATESSTGIDDGPQYVDILTGKQFDDAARTVAASDIGASCAERAIVGRFNMNKPTRACDALGGDLRQGAITIHLRNLHGHTTALLLAIDINSPILLKRIGRDIDCTTQLTSGSNGTVLY